MVEQNDAREYIESAVRERASHETEEDASITCSLAQAERILGGEYHGRFLIELLQNAADASRGSVRGGGRGGWKPEAEGDGRPGVLIKISEGPALVVANQGTPMSAEMVVRSLGHVGASVKAAGESIGHKGIGFKSVLEITRTPEIHSGLQDDSRALAVRFDAEAADRQIRERSPRWEEMLASVPGVDPEEPYSAIPVLRYPIWVEEPDLVVCELAERGYDTVVRLPFTAPLTAPLTTLSATSQGAAEEKWLAQVRAACAEVSDQILLLLGSIGEVRIEDDLDPSRSVVIEQEKVEGITMVDPGTTREVVRVRRNGETSSLWRLFRRRMPQGKELEEIAVGLRVTGRLEETLLPALGEDPSAPFHLFFPTHIRSGTPFLLHAYFEVDASRKGFYQGSDGRNEQMLRELAALGRLAVSDAVEDERFDAVSLVNLIARAGEPENPLARKFRADLLDLLDGVGWIPIEEDGRSRLCRPGEVLRLNSEQSGRPGALIQRILDAFPPAYIRMQTGRGVPHTALEDDALRLVMERPSGCASQDAQGLFGTLEALCLPGDTPPWDGRDADKRFPALLDLFDALRVDHPGATRELLGTLQGNPESKLIPTVGPEGSRVLLAVPNTGEGGRERRVPSRSPLVMARIGASDGPALVPPKELGVAFLPDGLLSGGRKEPQEGPQEDSLVAQARPFGIRPFTVDDILDRLGIADTGDEERSEQIVSFLWRLLSRARTSAAGTRNSAREAQIFAPSRWFWCEPGSVWQDDAARAGQRRRRNLASVQLPCRDGGWRPAGEIAFGGDWARWISKSFAGRATAADEARVAAYEALEKICPGDHALLAPPEEVEEVLGPLGRETPSTRAGANGVAGFSKREAPGAEPERIGDGEDSESAEDEGSQNRELHAFLLRLGVWEVPPVEAFQSGTPQGRRRFPWREAESSEETSLRGPEHVTEPGGEWRFGLHGWSGDRHQPEKVYVAEDFRFRWSPAEMARRDPSALAASLERGIGLYTGRSTALHFCVGCWDGRSRHNTWRRSGSHDGYPSTLARQLRSEPWVPCRHGGAPLGHGARSEEAWWLRKLPQGAGPHRSPWHIVPLCGPETGVGEELRRLAGIPSLEDAPAAVTGRLLSGLRRRFEEDDPNLGLELGGRGNARQAFVGLHRLAYERLAELPKEEAQSALEGTGVLCEMGGRLQYSEPEKTRHDDGEFAAYVRRFIGRIPFVVIPRDRRTVATHLGVEQLALGLTRRETKEGKDVTEDVREFLGDRIPELLSIYAHHRLGAQTADPQSGDFRRRTQRIKNLRVRQVEDLIIDISVSGKDIEISVGEGDSHDLFLEGATTLHPLLYHDFCGNGWEERLRRKIAPFIARVLENPAYAHTFALYLQGDEAEREEFLQELGITREQTETLGDQVGVVGEEERLLELGWFAAILGYQDSSRADLPAEDLLSALSEAGLSEADSRRLVELGGGLSVRTETSRQSALSILAASGFDLKKLHERLVRLDAGDPGLAIRISRNLFRDWMEKHGMRLRTVLSGRSTPEAAKSEVESLRYPEGLRFELYPKLPTLLVPVVRILRAQGVPGSDAEDLPERLASRPAEALARLGGFVGVGDLDRSVVLHVDERSLAEDLKRRAGKWRDELRLLAVMVRCEEDAPYFEVRELDAEFAGRLPGDPEAPSELRKHLDNLFPDSLAEKIGEKLVDTASAPDPDREYLLRAAGVSNERRDRVLRALEATRLQRTRKLDASRRSLRTEGRRPIVPPTLRVLASRGDAEEGQGGKVLGQRKPDSTPTIVKRFKVDARHDQRKRELGDEGERWALAAVIDELLGLDERARLTALSEIKSLLTGDFEGSPVDLALPFYDEATRGGLDDEELVDALSGFLHLSTYSDSFGFDMMGWLPSGRDGKHQAVCIEVKSTSSEGFQLSSGELAVAERFSRGGRGDRYAILAVMRGRKGGVPERLDVLDDPVRLFEEGQLIREASGYRVSYETGSV